MDSTDFYFVELQSGELGKPFAGFAVGDFVDMMGKEVQFGADKLATYLKNTLAAIAANIVKGMPGLPIDARKHEKGEAAGWITSAELGEVTDSAGAKIPVLMFLAEWTKLGKELIGEKIMTNFSPTVDLGRETIRGGSLTNWPANVDDNGIPLFSAIELSEGVHVLVEAEQVATDIDEAQPANTEGEQDKNGDIMTLELTQEQFDEAVTSRVKDVLATFEVERPEPQIQAIDLQQFAEAFGLNTDKAEELREQSLDKLVELAQAQADLRWQQKYAEMQRSHRYAELAQRVTGGTPEAPRGISVNADTLKAELMKLSPEQGKFWGNLLESIVQKGLNDYAELGHSKQTKQLRPVPDFAVNALKNAIAAGADMAEFFELAQLGDASQYDLTPYQGGK